MNALAGLGASHGVIRGSKPGRTRPDLGFGLGRSLLLDALTRIEIASRDLGIRAVLVDAIDDAAARFYHRYGFESSELDLHVLMVTMSAVRNATAG